MRALYIGAALAALALPVQAQQPSSMVTIQAPCMPLDTAAMALKREGFVRVVTGKDTDGDPFAVYRNAEGRWRAVSFVQGDSGVVVCALLGGEGFSLDKAEPGRGA